MGRIIANKLKGMKWMAKVSLILVFTLVFSTFMHQGMFKPRKADAAVTSLDGWTRRMGAVPAAVGSWSTTSAAFTVTAGTNRLLVGGFCLETAAAATMTTAQMRLDGAAGTLFTTIASTAATSSRAHCYIGYLPESSVTAGSHTVYVNVALSASTITGIDVLTTQYEGVNQTTPTAATYYAANANNTAGTVTFGAAVNYWGSGMSTYIVENGGAAATLTNVAGFTTSGTWATSAHTVFASNATNATAGTYAATSQVTFGGTLSPRSALAVVAFQPALAGNPITVGQGSPEPANANAPRTSTNNALDSFTMAMSAGAGTATSIVVAGNANFNATNIPTNGVKIYRDTGTTVGTLDGSDTLVSSASTAIAGSSTTVTISSEGVTTSAVNYLVVIDINAGATLTDTITANVSGVTGTGITTTTDSDTASATLTVTAAPPPTTITSCADCHGNPPVDGTARNTPEGQFPGSHNKHAGTYGFVCTNCHISPLWTSFNHRDGRVQFTTMFGGVSGGSYSRAGSPNYWFTQVNSVSPGTCANTYCHSKGTGSTLHAGDPRTVIANTSPTWGSVVTCVSCHGNETGNPANGAPWYTTTKANSHQAHASAGAVCNKCHNATTSDGSSITSVGRHNNRTYDIAAGTGITIAWYTYSGTGGQCGTVSCHGGGSPRWGTGAWDCTGCHAGTITKTLGGGGTIRQITGAVGDFSRASRHLYNAGFNSILKWDCIVCHMEGWPTTASLGKTTAFHNEGAGPTGGMVNVRNVDNWTTGWAINNRAWTTTDYTNLDTFCLTCHDADGAAGINVNAANNGLNLAATRALTPFNTANYPGGVVGGWSSSPNAGPRTRVVNIKDKFYPGGGVIGQTWTTTGANYNGNPSQHAVIGARYSTVNASWTAATWASYTTKKTRQNVNVARETSLLSCADCHVLDAGSGAHGGTNPYNMWTTGVSTFCYRCHNSAVYNWTGAAAGSRITHSTLDGGNIGGDASVAYGIPSGTDENCFLCHASWNGATTVTRNASYGGIHGSWSSNTNAWYSAGGQRTAYRFAPGVEMKMSPATNDGGWTSVVAMTCYFNASTTQTFDSCNRHNTSVGASSTYNYGRPVKY